MPKLGPGGAPLMTAGGVPVLGPDCCCGTPCSDCTFDTPRQLYLTIDQFTLDGGNTCDAGCVGFGVANKPYAGGPTDPPNSGVPLVWYSGFATADPCEDAPSTIAYDITCEDGEIMLHMFSGAISWVHGADCTSANAECWIVLPTGTQSLGQVDSCDPFYLEAIVPIEIRNPDPFVVDVCGTGTMRFIISE